MKTACLAALLGVQEALPLPVPPALEEVPPLVVPVPPARDSKDVSLRWVGSLAEARLEARLRGCPVVLVITHDQGLGFDTVRAELYARPEFLTLAQQLVFVPAFGGTEHDFDEREVAGQRQEWCGLFQMPCDQHRANHAALLNRFIRSEYWHPVQVFLDSTGAERHRVEGHEVTLARFQEVVGRVQTLLGTTPLPMDEYRAAMVALQKTVAGREGRGHTTAIRELERRARSGLPNDEFRGYAGELAEQIRAEGQGLLDGAKEMLAEGRMADAESVLRRVRASFRGEPVAEAADQLLTALRKNR